MKKSFFYTAITISLMIVVIAGTYWLSRIIKSSPPLIFSEKLMLESLWRDYKEEYVESSGRTLDKQRNNITTSEGQAYTMLRAVWMGDKEVFDRSWRWTQENIQRPDNLFSWLYGRRSDGSLGVLTERQGQNTASDADVDIALALIFAYARWQEPTYLEEAFVIIPQIWEEEVVIINGQPYLAANNLEKESGGPTVLINPSYFAPYAYRIFSSIDQEHPWPALVDTSYSIIEQSMSLPLDRSESAALPPDWITMDRNTGQLIPSESLELTTNYGFDAMRVPWRLGLDAEWFGEPRARDLLAQMDFLGKEWETQGRIASTYTHDGQAILELESPAMYGTALAYFLVIQPREADKIYRQKLVSLYQPDAASWKNQLGYYDDNLAWFGLALYNRSLPNLHLLNLR